MPAFAGDSKSNSEADLLKSVDALQVLENNLKKWQKECKIQVWLLIVHFFIYIKL